MEQDMSGEYGINWLNFYKLITLQCLFEKYQDYIHEVHPMDSSFKNFVDCYEAAGWRVI